MRVPLIKPWRAFPALDALSDGECQAVVRDALLTSHPRVESIPWALGGLTLVVWATGFGIASQFVKLGKYIPVPADDTLAAIELLVTSVLAASFVGFLSRDLVLYVCIRRYLNRAACPKCAQPLHGLPVHSVGSEPNPGNQFVRCAECGKKHSLLDLGLTPRDLIPLEMRTIDPNFGAKRPTLPRFDRET